jgi:hypothetical protein
VADAGRTKRDQVAVMGHGCEGGWHHAVLFKLEKMAERMNSIEQFSIFQCSDLLDWMLGFIRRTVVGGAMTIRMTGEDELGSLPLFLGPTWRRSSEPSLSAHEASLPAHVGSNHLF